MPMFNKRDYERPDDDTSIPEGVVDLTYELTIERRLLELLEEALDGGLLTAPWLSADVDQLRAAWGIEEVEDEDMYLALLLGAIWIVVNLMSAIHEDCVPDLLEYLARYHDELDAQESNLLSSKDRRFLLAQITHFSNPIATESSRHATMRIVDSVVDDDGLLDCDIALHVVRYLMLLCVVLLGGDEEDARALLGQAKDCHNERSLQPIMPYYDELEESDEDSE